MSAFAAETPPEPEPQLSPEDVALSDWEENRAQLGIPDSSDFIGIGPWQPAERYEHHEETELEKYAKERTQLGVKDAPQSSAGNVRANPSPYRIV